MTLPTVWKDVPSSTSSTEKTMAAGIACLKEVMTDENYKKMAHLADLFGEGLRNLIRKYKLPACVPQIGTLGGLMFIADLL